MSFDVEKLYSLLPAIYRIRDSEKGYPLKELLLVMAEQAAVLEEDLDQLYDDQFIETCAEWIVPYIGDLIGARGIHSLTGAALSPAFSQRAQVANTIAYRRRKGTALVLEQLARDVTGWDAKVVEFFKLLATTQYMNHLRPGNLYSPDLRKWEPLERINTPFESSAHTADVRHIHSRRGKYNIPNIGIFLWRLRSYPLTESPAFKLDKADNRRYMFSPLGNNMKLFNKPEPEDTISHSAEPINVPMPLSRRVLSNYLEKYYGPDKSLYLKVNGVGVTSEKISDLITICDLSDINRNDWAHMNDQTEKFLIDPVLGRILVPAGLGHSPGISVSFHYGFSADMGGGEYERAESFVSNKTLIKVNPPYKNLQQELDNVKGGGSVELLTSGRYFGKIIIDPSGNSCIELRAADGSWPLLVLDGNSEIRLKADSEVILNGLLILGGDLKVTGPGKLRLIHCTLVPGLSPLDEEVNRWPQPTRLSVNSANTVVEIEKCIIGGLRVHEDAVIQITNSILDATDAKEVAYSGLSGAVPGGAIKKMENCTIIGKVHSKSMEMVSNVIFHSGLLPGDTWPAPVISQRLQQGCVRFSYVPWNSRFPRRYRCVPENGTQDAAIRPQFTSVRYGDPGYCQLSQCCPIEIRQGADDESEMGAFHDLFQPQRETNLRVRLEEYIRFGMEAGIFYES